MYRITCSDGEYRVSPLNEDVEPTPGIYLASYSFASAMVNYFFVNEKKELVTLKNNWEFLIVLRWDCIYASYATCSNRIKLGNETLYFKIGTEDRYPKLAAVVFGISENCHTINEAIQFLENLGIEHETK